MTLWPEKHIIPKTVLATSSVDMSLFQGLQGRRGVITENAPPLLIK